MGEVIVTFKVMPKTVETNLDELENKINEEIKPERMEREPIAFGLVALKVTKLVPEAGGELEKVENKLRNIEDVGEVEVVEVSRSL